MPSKKTITREAIINAALKILRAKGSGGLSARAIAKELNTSTMPIYSNVTSMRNLQKHLDDKILSIANDYTRKSSTGDIFIDIAWGYIRFAREEKELFKLLFIDKRAKLISNYKKGKDTVTANFLSQLAKEPEFSDLSETEIAHIFSIMEIFNHGIASFIATNRFENTSDEYILSLLREMKELLLKRNILSEYLQIIKQGARTLASKIELSEHGESK
jgi:AcrR family transcriptional regulator